MIRNLDQQSGSVSLQSVGSHGAAVIQVFQDQEALIHDTVALLALDVRDKTNAASIVLEARVI